MIQRQDLALGAIQLLLLPALVFLTTQPAMAFQAGENKSPQLSARYFSFNYGAGVTGQQPGSDIQVWFPVPLNNPFQRIEIDAVQVPGILHINADHQYGNKIGYFESKVPEDGNISFSIRYQVERMEASHDGQAIDDETKQKFLQKNNMVPVSGKPLELIGDRQLGPQPMNIGRNLYEVVEQYMTYDKTNPGYGNGDVLWACNSKTGNCTDFHSLFISLARSQGLPARFEIGFPLPTDKKQGTVKGYHCWAWFHDNTNGWIPVDISEADKHPEMKQYYFGRLTADRIAFSTGRDIELFPKAASPPLNYFVYPHIEAGGKQVEKSQIQLDFSFEDREPKKKPLSQK